MKVVVEVVNTDNGAQRIVIRDDQGYSVYVEAWTPLSWKDTAVMLGALADKIRLDPRAKP